MTQDRPNILFVLTDDHASHAISAYGSVVNKTPNIDRIAAGGARLDNCFCTNALCTPSRASILTGTYSHINGVTTLSTHFDNRQQTFPGLLRQAGYATAVFGKWHLGHGPAHDPRGFDEWAVLPDQGEYWDPELIESDGTRHHVPGYATNIITDRALDWLRRRCADEPFCLLVNHKAPHRPWQPDTRHASLYADADIGVPETFDDDYEGRSSAARLATMRIAEDLNAEDLKEPVPEGLTAQQEARWKYQRYMSDYLRCVASVDDNVGRLLDHLDTAGLARDTIVVYSSDQGFFLGDHGWFDKRFMYEESLRMPTLVRYPREITAGSVVDELVTNVDFAQTFLDYAGVPVPERMQGRSMRAVLGGERLEDWRRSIYYRYWEHDDGIHHVWAHYGVRTRTHKLVYYYADGLGLPGASDRSFPPEWELFDLTADPLEMRSVHDDPAYTSVREELTEELARLQAELDDAP